MIIKLNTAIIYVLTSYDVGMRVMRGSNNILYNKNRSIDLPTATGYYDYY